MAKAEQTQHTKKDTTKPSRQGDQVISFFNYSRLWAVSVQIVSFTNTYSLPEKYILPSRSVLHLFQ